MMMEQLGKFEKKEKTFMHDDLNDEKQKVGKDKNKRKKEKRYNLD